jgi:hypothetical protein
MKKDKPKYLNFPISLLQGFMESPRKALDNIIDYCIVYEMKMRQKPFGEAVEAFNMVEPKNMAKWMEYATGVFNNTPMNQPRTGMEVTRFWEFHDEPKTDEEKATFLAFLAIKSIVGGLNLWYKLGKQEIIFHRMAGHTDCSTELPESIRRHCTRFKFDKIKMELQQHWGIVIYSNHTRGMYISTALSLPELALRVEKRKLATRQKQEALKAQHEAARTQALLKLGAGENLHLK